MTERWRAMFAYGGALAMVPYLLIKVFWTVGALAGWVSPGSFTVAEFVLLNVVTVGLAAVGVVLVGALIRPWGERIPARLLLPVAWLGCGFLVPMIPYLLATSWPPAESGSAMPGWESILIQVSL